MKKQLFLIIVSSFICFLFCNGCGTEPEKELTLMELLVGRYYTHFDVTDGNFIIGELNTENSTYQLELNSDYTFTLFIKGTHPKLDSTIIIDQKGTFEIIKSIYVNNTNCHQIYCRPYYDGNIMLYPENEKSWGGKFNCSTSNEGWGFESWRKIITKDGVEITFVRWDKING